MTSAKFISLALYLSMTAGRYTVVPSVEALSSDTQPMFLFTRSLVVEMFIAAPARALQYICRTSWTFSSSTELERVSRAASADLDSSLKNARPPSRFCWRMPIPVSNQAAIWLSLMRLSTVGLVRRRAIAASGDNGASCSARSRRYPWVPPLAFPRALEPSARKEERLGNPALARRSARRRNRPCWSSCTLARTLGIPSKQARTSRQLVSTKAIPIPMRARPSSPSLGSTSCPISRHSVARSEDFWARATTKAANRSNSWKGRRSIRPGVASKNLAERALDFQVPAYRLLPRFAHSLIRRPRMCPILWGLARKKAAANVGESLHKALPHRAHSLSSTAERCWHTLGLVRKYSEAASQARIGCSAMVSPFCAQAIRSPSPS